MIIIHEQRSPVVDMTIVQCANPLCDNHCWLPDDTVEEWCCSEMCFMMSREIGQIQLMLPFEGVV